MALIKNSLNQLLQGMATAIELRRAKSMWALALGNREIQSLYQLQVEAITKALEVDRAQYNLRYDSI